MAGGGQDTPLMSLSEELLLAVGEGRVTVATASRLAAARVREGGADATCTALAACQGQNGERNLHVWARGQPWRQLVPEPYHFTAPMRKKAREVTGTCYCILPHLFFSTLAREARPIFDSLFGDEDERVQFWTELRRTRQETPAGRRGEMHKQWYDKHPVIKSTAPEQRVPVGLHGDGGEMTSGQKVMVLSWGGLCNPGSTLDTRLLFMVIKESIAEPAGHATLYAAFDVLVWSLNAMADNMHPRVDHAGATTGRFGGQSLNHTPFARRVAGAAGRLAIPAGSTQSGSPLQQWQQHLPPLLRDEKGTWLLCRPCLPRERNANDTRVREYMGAR